MKTCPHRCSLFTAALLIIQKMWKHLKYPSTDEWVNKDGISIPWNTTQSLKGNEALTHATR